MVDVTWVPTRGGYGGGRGRWGVKYLTPMPSLLLPLPVALPYKGINGRRRGVSPRCDDVPVGRVRHGAHLSGRAGEVTSPDIALLAQCLYI